MTQAMEHYRQGNLRQALTTVAKELRQRPSDTAKRAFYAELLCLNGEFEKADSQLITLQALEPEALLTVGTWRRLLKAAQARNDVHANGRAPDLLADANEQMRLRLDVLMAIRDEDWQRAALHAQRLEQQRDSVPAVVNGKAVDDVRDLDDVAAGVLEVLASNGKYYWVDVTEVEFLTLHPPARPLDLLWRKADLRLHTGTEGHVFIPMIYPTICDSEQALLGRATQWQERAGLVRGIGQSTWLVGEDALPLSRLETLEIIPASNTLPSEARA
ncbi:MAG: hypothetical protein JJU06_11145 [Ectothiorhodospiraceae bacterium]|nr:hypothetical protein [Ectothiorhodospiraceae bacterium]